VRAVVNSVISGNDKAEKSATSRHHKHRKHEYRAASRGKRIRKFPKDSLDFYAFAGFLEERKA
jgi:hypothetical protein